MHCVAVGSEQPDLHAEPLAGVAGGDARETVARYTDLVARADFEQVQPELRLANVRSPIDARTDAVAAHARITGQLHRIVGLDVGGAFPGRRWSDFAAI